MIDTSVIRERFSAVGQDLNERSRRLLAAAEAKTAGHGWIGAASRATGVARSTIGRGLKDLAALAHCLAAVGGLGGGVRRRSRKTQLFWKTCASCWNPRQWAIRCVR